MNTLPNDFKYKAAFQAGRPQTYRIHPPMDRRKRAKIFAPFDALDGYSDSIDEKNVDYVERIFLETPEQAELDRRLEILHRLTRNRKNARKNKVEISVKYFVPCTDTNHFAYQLKGRYITASGICWLVDREETNMIIVGEVKISLSDVIEVTAADRTLFET